MRRDAAIIILKETQREMTAKELADVALQRGLVTSAEKTPDATLAAQLYARSANSPAVRWERSRGPAPAVRDEVLCDGRGGPNHV